MRFVAMFIALGTAQAAANPDGDAFKKSGLLGAWAQNCSEAVSEKNWYDGYYVTPDGHPTEALSRESGSFYRTSVLRDVKIISPTRVGYSMDHEDQNNVSETLDIVVQIENKRSRTWSSVVRGGSKTYIKDGKFTEGGGEAPWFNKCD
jgi:hypothetical protein